MIKKYNVVLMIILLLITAFTGCGGGPSSPSSTPPSNPPSDPPLDPPSNPSLSAPPISAGSCHNLALKSDGTVWAWGDNSSGQLGNGTTDNSTSPVKVSFPGGVTVTAIAAGGYHSLALTSNGTIYAWGYNNTGQIGNGTLAPAVTSPVKVSFPGGVTVTAIAAGDYYSMALTSDGTIYAWGDNSNGQLGNGTTVDKTSPVKVSSLSGVTTIAAGTNHSLALKNDGTAWSWGNNNNGQLGNEQTGNSFSSIPVQVSFPGGVTVTAVAAGFKYSMALANDGAVWAWGFNYYGQLGNGTNNQSTIPVQISTLSGVTAIASGDYHSLALKGDGTVYAWGKNSDGQLGNGTKNDRFKPEQIFSLCGVTAIAAGTGHSLALKGDGAKWAWGDNDQGQLGNGTTTDSTSPMQVE